MVKHFNKTGLFVREDSNLGLLIYSPFTGLFFSCMEDDIAKQSLIKWLKGKTDKVPSEDYGYSIGAGWHTNKAEARYPSEHILSCSNKKICSLKPDYPILINWLITTNCSCKCQYCYSQDLMINHSGEPTPTKVKQIAKNILSLNPLAVVLTGGDPLMSPNIETAIKSLHGKAGIIIDTNGIGITDNQISLFKKYNVFVRISLDSERPKINNEIRPSKSLDCSLLPALNCINRCLEKNISLGIQTVVTKKNLSDIEPLGHKLYRLGVTNWRLQMLANHTHFTNYSDWRPNLQRFVRTIFPMLGIKNRSGWDDLMSIQYIDNKESNAVILVSPEGNFLTELNGKQPLVPHNETKPTMQQIVKHGALNLDAHTKRYLNL